MIKLSNFYFTGTTDTVVEIQKAVDQLESSPLSLKEREIENDGKLSCVFPKSITSTFQFFCNLFCFIDSTRSLQAEYGVKFQTQISRHRMFCLMHDFDSK